MTRQEVLMTFAQGCRKILQGDLSKLIVYGSYARGDYREDSDIDVMILTPLSNQQIEKVENAIFDLAFDLEMESGIVINPVIENEAHYQYWLGALPFYNNVEREGIANIRLTKEYVAKEIFPREIGRKLGALQKVREKSDYDDFYIASREKAEEQFQTAELVIAAVKEYLKKHE